MFLYIFARKEVHYEYNRLHRQPQYRKVSSINFSTRCVCGFFYKDKKDQSAFIEGKYILIVHLCLHNG